MATDEEEAFPVVVRESEQLRSMFALHAYNLQHSPALAHWTAAGVSTALGCVLAAGRGAFVALTQPPVRVRRQKCSSLHALLSAECNPFSFSQGLRWSAFISVSRSAAPLYIIPFVLGSQVDCFEASWERQGHKPREWSGAAADLG